MRENFKRPYFSRVIISVNCSTSDMTSVCLFVCFWRDSRQWARASSFTRFLDHTQRRSTVGRTPLDEWSARRRDLYLTTHSTHNWQISMPPVGSKSTISAGERPQIYALDRAATGTGFVWLYRCKLTYGAWYSIYREIFCMSVQQMHNIY